MYSALSAVPNPRLPEPPLPCPCPGARPEVRLELQSDPRVLAAAVFWTAACASVVWLADLPAPLLVPASATLLALGLPVVASQRFGGSGHRPAAVRWRADGGWECEFTDGTSEEMELCPESRGFPAGVLLLFRKSGAHRRGAAPSRVRYWLLARQQPAEGDPVRRLRVRLELDRDH